MNLSRRGLLTSLGVAVAAPGSGCLSDPRPSEPTSTVGSNSGAGAAYETCTATFVTYSSLPDDVVPEVDTALEDGAYETSGAVRYAQAVGDETPLLKDETYYSHRVEQTDTGQRLTFEEWTAYDSAVELAVTNETAEAITVAVEVTDATADPVLSDEFTVESNDGRTRPITAEFGEYTVDVTVDDERRASDTWRVGPRSTSWYWGGTVVVSEETVRFEREAAIYDKPVCPWEE